jgi:hypothetical protein
LLLSLGSASLAFEKAVNAYLYFPTFNKQIPRLANANV